MRSPDQHYQRADELMAKVADMHDPCLPIARHLTAQAAVHAALAQCGAVYESEPWEEFDPRLAVETRETTGGRL